MSALMSLTTQLSPLQCLEEESLTFVCFLLHPGGANEGPDLWVREVLLLEEVRALKEC